MVGGCAGSQYPANDDADVNSRVTRRLDQNAEMRRYEIDADASDEDIEALVAQSQKRSAVFDAITNPTNVTVTVG